MPSRPQKATATPASKSTKAAAAPNKNAGPAVKARSRVAAEGKTTRINAFVSSRGRRTQAKRDAR